jgi:metalloendopeptidase OMA1, mitochondrial
MIALRTAWRAAGRAASRGSVSRPDLAKHFNHRPLPRLQPRRFASRYTRFGGKPGGSGQQQQQWSNFGPVYRAQYIWRNYRTPIIVVGAGGGVFYVSNLEEVPVSHRRRFNMISPAMEKELFAGQDVYESALRENRGKILPPDHPLTQTVAHVADRLLQAGGLADGDWRVHVINEPQTRNAFVMPGGQIFVYTGILPICKDETGLAAVLGHEIAHNVAHHVSERASISAFIIIAAWAFSYLLDVSGQFGSSIAQLILSLPNSRTQEAEADHIGLLMMAQACYDPQAALDLWARMNEAEKGQPPQFLSTHPSHYNRIGQLTKLLPQAQQVFANTGCDATSRHAIAFNEFTRTTKPAFSGQMRPNAPANARRNSDDDDFF